jgi:hypothetical protein
MKTKIFLLSLITVTSLFNNSTASANQAPIVESLKFSPSEIEVSNENTNVAIELIVSHPKGLENLTTIALVKDALGNTWGTQLVRTDFPVDPALSRVTFKGSIDFPKSISPGIYVVTSSEVRNNSSAGYQYSTGTISATKFRDFLGGENNLFVRSFGNLDFEGTTFLGPSYDLTKFFEFKDSKKFNSTNRPIWRVNEIFDPSLYFEMQVKNLPLKIKSSTIRTCEQVDGKLILKTMGTCSFVVYTDKNMDYKSFEYSANVEISEPRVKPVINLVKLENQTSKDLPKTISLSEVYLASEGYIFPKSITPSICVAIVYSVRILSGGICTLTYRSIETDNFLASDIYEQTFDILRDPQTITFTLSSTANVSSRSIALAATASSGGAITYSTTSAGICSITGSTLNLLRNGNCAVIASQAGTSTFAPASTTATVVLSGAAVANRNTITCVKGKSTKTVSGVNPKCPRGFKIKR